MKVSPEEREAVRALGGTVVHLSLVGSHYCVKCGLDLRHRVSDPDTMIAPRPPRAIGDYRAWLFIHLTGDYQRCWV